MRLLTSILALLSVIWAFLGITGWIWTILSIQYIESAIDAANILIRLILLLSGYFVWLGWIFYSFRKRFPFMTVKSFWIFSLIHHISCALHLAPIDIWRSNGPWWIPAWIIANVVIASIVITREAVKKINAKPDAAPKN